MQAKLAKHNFFAKLASVLVFILIFSTLFSAAAYSSTSQQQQLDSINQQINSHKQKISSNNQSKTQLENIIKDADSKISDIATRLSELQTQLKGTKAKMSATQIELDKLQAQLGQKRKELDAALKELKRLSVILNNRASSFYKSGSVSYLEVILSAKSFSDLLHQVDYLSRVVNQDAQLVRQIKDTKATIESAKAAIEKNKATTEQKHATLVKEENWISSLAADQQSQKVSLTGQLNSEQSKVAGITSQNKQLAAEMDDESVNATQLTNAINGPSLGAFIPAGSPSLSGFIWPVAGGNRSMIYSDGEFAYSRPTHYHAGIDITAGINVGTPVYAVKSGVVSAVQNDPSDSSMAIGVDSPFGGYGKVVDIDHGGGVVSRYAHLSVILVHYGDTVQRGQKIALSGNTPAVSVPHLHFEIRTNGDSFSYGYGHGGSEADQLDGAVNPLNYLP